MRSPSPSALTTVETAFFASTASLLWLVNTYFPLGPVLRIFFSIPVALAYLRWGVRASWMTTLIAGLLLSVLMGPTRSVLYVMPYGLLGVLLGCLWRRGARWGWMILLGTLLGTVGFFFRIGLVSILLGDDLWVYLTTQTVELLDWGIKLLGLTLQPSLGVVQGVALGMIVLNSALYVFVVHLAAWFLLERLGNPIPSPPPWVANLFDLDGF